MLNLTDQLIKALSPYTPADGPYLDLGVLQNTHPGTRWDCVLLGRSSQHRAKATRRLPLLGRKYMGTRVVVLVSSLAEWLQHYHPDGAQVMLAGLQLAQRQHEAGLKRLREETRLKQGEPRGRKPRPRPVKQPPPPVVTSAAIFGVWKC